MPNLKVSLKHIQVDKANSAVVAALSVASFVLVFAGFAANALMTQRNYQARVILEKSATLDKIDQNYENAQSLQTTYGAFVSNPQNIIGGSSEGDGQRDGDNARIILDSLPSSYDFPALVTSMEKLLTDANVNIEEISGTDNELTQGVSEDELGNDIGDEAVEGGAVTVDEGSIEIPLTVGISSSYDGVKGLIGIFERSIRPFHIGTMTISGSNNNMRLDLQIKTYFQPEKVFEVRTEVVL
ncbi:hypothetical protein BH23PAT2_BH23PAT2_03120 [soil metagenome]